MSQYGANAMAKEGSTYKDILKYYYQGITIEEYKIWFLYSFLFRITTHL